MGEQFCVCLPLPLPSHCLDPQLAGGETGTGVYTFWAGRTLWAGPERARLGPPPGPEPAQPPRWPTACYTVLDTALRATARAKLVCAVSPCTFSNRVKVPALVVRRACAGGGRAALVPASCPNDYCSSETEVQQMPTLSGRETARQVALQDRLQPPPPFPYPIVAAHGSSSHQR